MTIVLDDFATNADIRDKILPLCDIDVAPDEDASWITIDGSTDFSVIARDGSGGLLIVMPPSRRVIYASSEGDAGVVAADAEELLALIATCPWWQDVLRYSGKDTEVAEMRRAAPVLESHWMGDEDARAQAREALTSRLGIAEPDDVIGALHRAVSTPVDVRFHGVPAQSLFGRFTIDDNPFYRLQKE
jgi:hypothetical protein